MLRSPIRPQRAITARRRRRVAVAALLMVAAADLPGRRGPAPRVPIPEIARPDTRIVLLRPPAAVGERDGRPFERAGYRWRPIAPDPTAAFDGEVLWLDGRDVEPDKIGAMTRRLHREAEAGARVVVHDPTGALAELMPPRDDATTGWVRFEPRDPEAFAALRPASEASLLAAELRTRGIRDPVYPSHGGHVDSGALRPGDRHLVVRRPNEVVSACRPIGDGAIVYSRIALREFLRAREESRLHPVLAARYAPALVAYAAWGACNDATRWIPLRIDPIPGDPDNRVRRRGVAVLISSRSGIDVVRELDTTSLRMGRAGTEESLHRCMSVRDQDGDGLRDLSCVFTFHRLGLGHQDSRIVLTGATRTGLKAYAEAPVELPSMP